MFVPWCDCRAHNKPVSSTIPYNNSSGVEHYKEGKDSKEKFLPSKLTCSTNWDFQPFSTTGKTALNFGILFCCVTCSRSHLMYGELKALNECWTISSTFVALLFNYYYLLLLLSLFQVGTKYNKNQPFSRYNYSFYTTLRIKKMYDLIYL